MKNSLDPFDHQIWVAFGRLIEKRFQCHIGFSSALDVDHMGRELIVTSSGDVLIPLIIENQFFGTLRVKEGADLAPEDIESIREIFQKMGESFVEGSRDLRSHEEPFEVLPVRKQLINLVGGDLDSRLKLTTEIHETLKSLSLVSWGDAGMDSWNGDDLQNLENICIYIKDIFDLSPKEQQQLKALTKTPHSQRPQLLVASGRPLRDYIEDGMVDAELAQIFSETVLFVEQMPKEYLLLKEVLEMLLDRDNLPSGSAPGGDLIYI